MIEKKKLTMFSPRCTGLNKTGSLQIDIKSGRIMLIQASNGKQVKHTMFMKIFRNEYEHHAQLYTDSDYRFMFGYISMRKCKIYTAVGSNEIVIYNSEKHSACPESSQGLVFEVEKYDQVFEWVEALTPDEELPKISDLSPLAPRRTV